MLENREPHLSTICVMKHERIMILFRKMTLFRSCGLVEEAASLSLNNKDLLFIAMYFSTYLNAKTNLTKFRDINQKSIFLMNFAFALRDPR